jgi:hypothetical protein
MTSRNGSRRGKRAPSAALAAVLALASLSSWSSAADDAKSSDPLAAEIARWSNYLATHDGKDENWQQIQSVATPVMAGAEKALADGRRYLALQRLAAVRPMLSATVYVGEHTGPESKDEAAFEAEWERMGRELRADLGAIPPGAFDGVRPAAVRAMAEAALPQVRGFYDASLEFGKSTDADSGLFYLGSARAQREFAAFCRTLALPGVGPPPKLRPLSHELDELEARLFAAYRPPTSIDRHGEFIGANSTLNEARQLDAAGLRYGALARYLQAALRTASLLPPAAPSDGGTLVERLRGFETRLAAPDTDHSIGRIFLESAQADVAANTAKAANAEAIAADVLPRYFAALQPAAARPVQPPPAVTVTLVRWPYT